MPKKECRVCGYRSVGRHRKSGNVCLRDQLELMALAFRLLVTLVVGLGAVFNQNEPA